MAWSGRCARMAALAGLLAALARDRLAARPADAQAGFALGVAQFLGAVEGLGQELYRYGLQVDGPGDGAFAGLGPPFLIAAPRNPSPEPVTYEALRQVIGHFHDRLTEAEATLARVPADRMTLLLDLTAIRLDLNGDGRAGQHERADTLPHVALGLEMPETVRQVTFDESDVTWLQGYCHMLSASADLLLAHDWHIAFEQTFHGFFPDSPLPSARLADEAASAAKRLAAGTGQPAQLGLDRGGNRRQRRMGARTAPAPAFHRDGRHPADRGGLASVPG